MNFKKIFVMQKELDKHILESNNITEDVYRYLLVAFRQEFAEMINEKQFFKFWKKNKGCMRSKLLEEAVDCLHFLLSIGNNMGINYFDITDFNYADLITNYDDVMRYATNLSYMKDEKQYHLLASAYFKFVKTLDITVEELEEGYYKKNKVNHERQESGY